MCFIFWRNADVWFPVNVAFPDFITWRASSPPLRLIISPRSHPKPFERLSLVSESQITRSKNKRMHTMQRNHGALLRKINYKIKASSQRIFKPGFDLVGTSAVWHSESGFENLCWFKWTRHGIFLLYKKVQWVVFRIRRYWDVISKHFPP